MTIPWGMLQEKRSIPAMQATIRSIVTETSYGKGPKGWTLTELITARSNESVLILRMLEGAGPNGRPSPDTAIMDSTGRPFVFKLRVLTRQACAETADGWAINQRNALMIDNDETERVLAVRADEKPVPGDIVKVKGNFRWHDPVTGKLLMFSERLACVARYEAEVARTVKPQEATFYWTRYTVDKDGCITVPFMHALQLMSKYGKRIVNPQWRRANAPDARGNRIEERRITNWHFEEVIPDLTQKAK